MDLIEKYKELVGAKPNPRGRLSMAQSFVEALLDDHQKLSSYSQDEWLSFCVWFGLKPPETQMLLEDAAAWLT